MNDLKIDVIVEDDKVYITIPVADKVKQYELSFADFMRLVKENSIDCKEFDC